MSADYSTPDSHIALSTIHTNQVNSIFYEEI